MSPMLPATSVGTVTTCGRCTSPFSGSFVWKIVRCTVTVFTTTSFVPRLPARIATATTAARATKMMTRLRVRFMRVLKIGDGLLRRKEPQRDAQFDDRGRVCDPCVVEIDLSRQRRLLPLLHVHDGDQAVRVLQLRHAGCFRCVARLILCRG